MPTDSHSAHREAAEAIRAHLVVLRGGAPFLSPLDAKLLLKWLDEGETVSRIIAALERAARARQKRPSRLPLTLRQAKRHLKAIAHSPLVQNTPHSSHPLEPLCAELVQIGAAQPDGLSLIELAADLHRLEIKTTAELLREALGLIRAFFERRWQGRSCEEREDLLQHALSRLKNKKIQADTATLHLLAEEHARQVDHKALPQLSATHLLELLR